MKPVLIYHGSKFKISNWIVKHLPEHKLYVEPFGGGAGVLLNKPKSFHEIYNDIDSDLYNFFRVVKDKKQLQLLESYLVTIPFSRKSFENAYIRTDNEILKAANLVIRSRMGFASSSSNINYKTGFRATSKRASNTAADEWPSIVERLIGYAKRLETVVLENKDAFDLIKQVDDVDALFYIDPPYLHDTRHNGSENCYKYEFTVAQHVSLLTLLKSLKGKVIISSYHNDLYAESLKSWKLYKKKTINDKRNTKIECLWVKDNINVYSRGAAKAAYLKRSKTEKLIMQAINKLKKDDKKITKTAISKMINISRENISKNYSHLFD